VVDNLPTQASRVQQSRSTVLTDLGLTVTPPTWAAAHQRANTGVTWGRQVADIETRRCPHPHRRRPPQTEQLDEAEDRVLAAYVRAMGRAAIPGTRGISSEAVTILRQDLQRQCRETGCSCNCG
jgi:hypothetical protein